MRAPQNRAFDANAWLRSTRSRVARAKSVVFRFAWLNKDADEVPRYDLSVRFPDGWRAQAIREAQPKARKSDTGPRARLEAVDGGRGARLSVGSLQQGETVSLQVDLSHASPPWGWLVAGLLLSAGYVFSFRDLVRRPS